VLLTVISHSPCTVQKAIPVDGSTSANHAVAYALSLARDRRDTEVILLNVQMFRCRETLEVSDFAAVITADAE
jgi:hypothetical protein